MIKHYSLRPFRSVCRSRSTQIALVVLVAVVSVCSSMLATARPELGPPSIQLRSNLANVAIAEVTEISPKQQLTLSKQVDLHNTAGQQIVIRSDANINRLLKVGESYVVAYVTYDVQRFPRVVRERRDGAVIISLPGAAPAIFPPHAALVKMLEWDIEESQRSPDEMLPLILWGMSSSDRQIQDFFTTELVTRPRLYQRLTDSQKSTVREYIASTDYSPSSRELMLDINAFTNSLLSTSQRVRIADSIVSQYPVTVDRSATDGSLIKTAMRILEQSHKPANADNAYRWLTSNQPALIESAAAIIYEVKPDTLLAALENALKHSPLEQQSKQTLEQLKKRYSRDLKG